MRPQMPNFKTNNNAYHNLGCIKLGIPRENHKTIQRHLKVNNNIITKKCKQISRPPPYLNVNIIHITLQFNMLITVKHRKII